MADITISGLIDVPTLLGSQVLPISDGSTTYKTTIASLTAAGKPVITATGGTETIITERGVRYKVHAFTTVGTGSLNIATASNNPTVEVLIVAGGGGGGGELAGGGGAGGVYYSKSIPITAGNKTVNVGTGGIAGGTTRYVNTVGGDGGLSQFDIYSVAGGGGGGTYWQSNLTYTNGRTGGCGGGAGSVDSSPFATGGTGSRGTNNVLGGNGGGGGNSSYTSHAGGGGGGAGGNGETADPYYMGGEGGTGILCDITGVAVFYAGGGAGSTAYTNAAFTRINGGLGGGGAGGAWYGYPNNLAGVNGTDGLGGGGGGGNYGSAPAGGGKGGSGIVIVRYPIY